jgi:DNA-binding beta-propeller fold protein YncE
VRVGSGPYTFDWIDDWARVPHTDSTRLGWAHPGMATTEAGDVIACHPSEPSILVFDRHGALLRTMPTALTEGHGITVVKEGATEFLWVADPGSKRKPELGYESAVPRQNGRVVKMALDGQIVAHIEAPELPNYRAGTFAPTCVAVNEERHGGNGDVWVADGYGENLVHRYSRFNKNGEYLGTISGNEGLGGRFTTPHGLWFDPRRSEPELYVADRGNRRIQVFDPQGQFKRTFGQDFLSSPSAFALLDGETLVVAELRARLALVDRDDRLIAYIGADEAVCDRPGWPNAKNTAGEAVRPASLTPGKFNSPHGLAADVAGNLYVGEWLIGGRYTQLLRVAPPHDPA